MKEIKATGALEQNRSFNESILPSLRFGTNQRSGALVVVVIVEMKGGEGAAAWRVVMCVGVAGLMAEPDDAMLPDGRSMSRG